MNRQWSANPRLVGRKLATRAARSACVEQPEQLMWPETCMVEYLGSSPGMWYGKVCKDRALVSNLQGQPSQRKVGLLGCCLRPADGLLTP